MIRANTPFKELETRSYWVPNPSYLPTGLFRFSPFRWVFCSQLQPSAYVDRVPPFPRETLKRSLSHFNLPPTVVVNAHDSLLLSVHTFENLDLHNLYKMKLFSVLTVAFVASVSAQQDPMRDLQLGLQGLQQASKDPAQLAQLMKDLQVRRLLGPVCLLSRRLSSHA